MFYLGCHDCETSLINLEPYSVQDAKFAYMLTEDFNILSLVKSLHWLETEFRDDEIIHVLHFSIVAEAAEHGVLIKAVKFGFIKAPLRTPKAMEDTSDVEVCSDEKDVKLPYHSDDDALSIETGDSESTDADVSDKEIEPKPILPQEKAIEPDCAGAKRAPKVRKKFLWQDAYFYIPDVCPKGYRIHIHRAWTAEHPDGMGRKETSKYITFSKYGDDPLKYKRTMILLRAWAYWRANKDGWAALTDLRKRHFEEALSSLRRDIAALKPAHGILGNVSADDLLRTWASQVVP